MSVSLTPNEEAQLSQTIEMFEVITQSQPLDYQSLEILKEAYSKLGRPKEAVRTSKRIAEAYMLLGQLSSAILEYESILQRFPEDPDVRKALAEIELKATNLSIPKAAFAAEDKAPPTIPWPGARKSEKPLAPVQIDDGRQTMREIFVEGKFVSERDFNALWPAIDPHQAPRSPVEPFIQVLAEKRLVELDISLKLILQKARIAFLPLEKYDIDMDLARGFPRDLCQRWCILPFDRMSKSVLIGTANPFNKQAVREVEDFIKGRVLWYLGSPPELIKLLHKVFQ